MLSSDEEEEDGIFPNSYPSSSLSSSSNSAPSIGVSIAKPMSADYCYFYYSASSGDAVEETPHLRLSWPRTTNKFSSADDGLQASFLDSIESREALVYVARLPSRCCMMLSFTSVEAARIAHLQLSGLSRSDLGIGEGLFTADFLRRVSVTHGSVEETTFLEAVAHHHHSSAHEREQNMIASANRKASRGEKVLDARQAAAPSSISSATSGGVVSPASTSSSVSAAFLSSASILLGIRSTSSTYQLLQPHEEVVGQASTSQGVRLKPIALLVTAPMPRNAERGKVIASRLLKAANTGSVVGSMKAASLNSSSSSSSPSSTFLIPGLLLIENFISEEEEKNLLEELDSVPWWGGLVRRVQHYGIAFDYVSRQCLTTPSAAEAASNSVVDKTNTAVSPTTTSKPSSTIHEFGSHLRAVTSRIGALGFVGNRGDVSIGNATCEYSFKWIEGSTSIRDLRAMMGGGATSHALSQDAAAAGASVSAAATSTAASVSPPSSPVPNQVTVNEYRRGQGISGHIDTHEAFEDGVTSLSLGGEVVMEFIKLATDDDGGGEGLTTGSSLGRAGRPAACVALPPRSLLVLRGEARYAWSHSIPARSTDLVNGYLIQRPDRRVSITARVIDPQGLGLASCPCRWPSVCTSQRKSTAELFSPHLIKQQNVALSLATSNGAAASGGSQLAPPEIEKKHVHALYDAIAPHFSSTRYAPWPAVEKFLCNLPMTTPASAGEKGDADVSPPHSCAAASPLLTASSVGPPLSEKSGDADAPIITLPKGALILDVGCGNGKYLHINAETYKVGFDTSIGLLDICAGKGFEVTAADAVSLPVRSHLGDATLCIAVLHHISNIARRRALIKELIRITSPAGGAIFVQAWALEQNAESRSRTIHAIPEGQAIGTDFFLKQPSTSSSKEEEGGKTLGATAFTDGTTRDVFVPWSFQSRFFQAPLETTTPATTNTASSSASPPTMLPVSAGLSKLIAAAGGQLQEPVSKAKGGSTGGGGGSVVFERYCHLYSEGELDSLFRDVASIVEGERETGGEHPSSSKSASSSFSSSSSSSAPLTPYRVSIERSWWEKDNWCIIVRRWS